MYSSIGRPSIPPARLLKSCLLIALYSVRSDRLFCENLDYNPLYRWFLDMSMDESSFDASSFSKNRDRLLDHDVAQKVFDAVVRLAREGGLLSDDPFTVDGKLIEAYASLKSFKKKLGTDGEGKPANRDDDPPDNHGNPTVDFRGEKRSHRTHEITTDPESRLLRKEARLTFRGHALMENRNGILVFLKVSQSVGVTETEAAASILKRQARRRVRAKALGADKNDHVGGFVAELRDRGIRPHIAMRDDRHTPGLDGRTTRHIGYDISQRIRKRVEEAFGWMRTVGGLRKSRFLGVDRNQLAGYIVAAASNLRWMANLWPAPA